MKGLESERVPAKADWEPYHQHCGASSFYGAKSSFQISDDARPQKLQQSYCKLQISPS